MPTLLWPFITASTWYLKESCGKIGAANSLVHVARTLYYMQYNMTMTHWPLHVKVMKMPGYWQSSFLCFFFMDQDQWKIKKEAIISSHLEWRGLVNKGSIIQPKKNFFLAGPAREFQRREDGPILHIQVVIHNIWKSFHLAHSWIQSRIYCYSVNAWVVYSS